VFIKSTPENHTGIANSKKNPQEYMQAVFVTIFTEQGFLKDELSANNWAYLPEAQASTLVMPRLIVHKPDGTVWTIQARKGNITQPTLGTIEKITLQQEVILERPATETVVPIKLETDELHYQPQKQYATSDQFITMIRPNLKITGTGLRAFLDQSSVELLRDVKTYYTVTR
jgi:LPS export ABC transporter protein LptC